MPYDEITALLGGWEGFELVGVRSTAVEPERGHTLKSRAEMLAADRPAVATAGPA